MKTETLTITEHFKYYKCGGYGFGIYHGPTLIVSTPRVNTPEDPQHHYKMHDCPENQWLVLEDSNGELLPIYIRWNRVTVQVQVGSAPHAGDIPRWAVGLYSRAWSFKMRRDASYQHPEGGFLMSFQRGLRSTTYDEILVSVNVAGEALRFNTAYLPAQQWVVLQYPPPQSHRLPIMVCKDQNHIYARWLPLASLTE